VICDRCLHPIHDKTLDDVIDAAIALFGVTREVLTTDKTRRAAPARARLIAWYVAHERLGFSYPEIGDAFDRDHTSVLGGVRRIKALLETGAPGVAHRVDLLTEAVGA
jgi:chromosomal replication initiator protein